MPVFKASMAEPKDDEEQSPILWTFSELQPDQASNMRFRGENLHQAPLKSLMSCNDL
jgi:hypothetical protein